MIAGAAVLAAIGIGPSACGAPAETPTPAAPERSPAGLEEIGLTVESGARQHRFIVEVARSPEAQQTGLMNRSSLAADRGMLFPYDPPQMASFWMKNTLIPLDIIFIRPDGTIARIAANTTPLSLEPIPSLELVSAVLELAGGQAAKLGIKPGDRVRWDG